MLKDNMLKNHGYYKVYEDDIPTSVVSSEEGVFQFIPPANGGDQWEIKTLIEDPTSDAVLIDLDEDGNKELCTLQDFHGDTIKIYHLNDQGDYEVQYEFPEKTDFLHAIGGFEINGKPMFVTGYRGGKKNLMAIYYDPEKETYSYELIDEGRGPANIYHFVDNGIDKIVATNRETDEIALYTITE